MAKHAPRLLVARAILLALSMMSEPAMAQFAGPYIGPEARAMSSVWSTIRGAARYEDINWVRLAMLGPPGSPEAQRLTAQHWDELRGAARFEDIDWYATTGFGEPPSTTTPRAPMAPGGAFSDLRGVWAGTYQSLPMFSRLTLDVPDDAVSDGGLVGTLRIEDRGGGSSGPIGLTSVRILFDPLGQTLVITPDDDADRVGLQNRRFIGFVDTTDGVIAGVVTSQTIGSPYFVLTVPSEIEGHLYEPIDEAYSSSRRDGPLAAFRSGGPDRQDLERWAQTFLDEYPDFEAYRRQEEGIFNIGRNLFADRDFNSAFGTTFDRMSQRERNGFQQAIQESLPARLSYSDSAVQGILRAVERAFSSSIGTHSAPDVVLSTIAIRHLTRWRMQTLDRLENLEPSLESFKAVRTIDTLASQITPLMWASERAVLAAAVEAAFSRTAQGAVPEAVATLISRSVGLAGGEVMEDARTKVVAGRPPTQIAAATDVLTGRGSARGFAADSIEAVPTLEELAPWAPSAWQAAQPDLRHAIDRVVTEALAASRAELGLNGNAPVAAPDPEARLRRGKEWYARDRALFDRFGTRPEVNEMRNDFMAQREADLSRVVAGLAARIAGLDSSSEVLRVGSDIGIDLDAAGVRSWQSLERVRMMRLAQLEQEAHDRRIAQILGEPPPANPPNPQSRPPTELEMLEYFYYVQFPNIRAVQGCNDDENFLEDLTGCYYITTFEQVTSAEEGGRECEAARDRRGYYCYFRMGFEVRDAVVFQDPDLGGFASGLFGALTAGHETARGYFEYLGPEVGWGWEPARSGR